MLGTVLLVVALIVGAADVAAAQTAVATPAPAPVPAPVAAAAAPLSAPEAQQLLEVLRDDAKRAQLLSVLDGLAKALPALPVAAVPAGPATPAAGLPAAAAPPPAPPAAPVAVPHPVHAAAERLAIPLAPNSLGAEILVGASDRLTSLSTQLGDAARAVTDFPLFARWLIHLATDQDTRSDLLDAAWKLAVVLAAGLIAERLARRLVRRPAEALAEHAPAPNGGDTPTAALEPERVRLRHAAVLLLRRLPYVLARLALDMLPVLAVAAVGYALVGTPLGAPDTARLVILAVVNAYVLCRALVTLVRALVAPAAPRLRLLPITDSGAAYILSWSRRMIVTGVFGCGFAGVALLFGLYRVAHDTLLKLVVLAIHVALIVIVLQNRRLVAGWIRGRDDAAGPAAMLRKRLAAVWHIVAIFYLVALWLVWAFEVQDGFSRLLRVFVATVVVVTLARLAIVAVQGAVDRWVEIDPALSKRYPGLQHRVRRYHPVARALASWTIAGLALVVVVQACGFDSFGWFESGALGGRVLSGLVTIGLTVAVALTTWEVANATVERRLAEVTRDGRTARSARLLTLLPMLRTALLVAIFMVAGLMVLSEIGVNIAPLLAGAGVVGIAIGFGSQKLVQDIITGLFLLLENTMQVGDVITLGGLTGTVENLSIRTIRLRALDGSVYIVPFSAVTTVTNMTRDYGYAVLDIGVGLSEPPDHVAGVVREVARKMRAEPRWGASIRDDIEVLGIERFVDLAYILRVRVMTLPGQRWAVGRELNERIKERFDELAIDSPITSTKVLGVTPGPPPRTPGPETGMVAG